MSYTALIIQSFSDHIEQRFEFTGVVDGQTLILASYERAADIVSLNWASIYDAAERGSDQVRAFARILCEARDADHAT